MLGHSCASSSHPIEILHNVRSGVRREGTMAGVCGSEARSKHSEIWRRSFTASRMPLKKNVCSRTPGHPAQGISIISSIIKAASSLAQARRIEA